MQLAGRTATNPAEVAAGAPVTGQCQRHDQDRFGCYAEVNDGKAGATLCVD